MTATFQTPLPVPQMWWWGQQLAAGALCAPADIVHSPEPAWFSLRSVAGTHPHRGTQHSTGRARILCLPTESGVTTGSRVAMVGRPGRFFREKANSTKKMVVRFECVEPNNRSQRMLASKRCKPFELGGDKRKGQTSRFVCFLKTYFYLF